MYIIPIMLTLFLPNLLTLFQLLLTFCFMISKYKMYMINDKQKVNYISKQITCSTFIDEHKKPAGFFIGPSFIGYIYAIKNSHDSSLYKELYILIDGEKFAKISCSEQELQNTNNISNKITLWYRTGNFYWLQWESRSIDCFHQAMEKQNDIIINMREHYSTYNKGVFFICGDPGSGKSTLLQLLGHSYNCHICKKHKPTEPGDTLDYIYKSASPSIECPLIILFDEIETMIDDCHNKTIVKHKHIPIEIYDTNTYNTFFDDINDNMYPYLIVLLTSNQTKETIDEKCHSCYLRLGRVDKYFKL